MKTRAAVVAERGGECRVETVDLSPPGPGEVRVRIAACGICRSDLHAIDGGEDVRYPAVLGHEACGTVAELGPDVTSPGVGEQVVLSWTPACGECGPCRRGEVHLCRRVSMSAAADPSPLTREGRPLDRFMRLGAFCEQVVVPAVMAVPVDRRIPASLACLLGCGVMTGFGAAFHSAAVRPGESVAVLGCGGVGLAAIQGARVAGAAAVYAVDPLADRRDAARKVGATCALAPEEARARILADTDEGVDVAVECVGRPEVVLTAVSLTRPGGRTVMVGLPGLTETLTLPALILLPGRSLTGSIYGSARPPVDFPALVEHWREGRLDLATLVGLELPFERIQDGIDITRRGDATRVVLTFG